MQEPSAAGVVGDKTEWHGTLLPVARLMPDDPSPRQISCRRRSDHFLLVTSADRCPACALFLVSESPGTAGCTGSAQGGTRASRRGRARA